MDPLVSVIVPVYNSEKWIKKSIMSVRNQTYKNIEVIIVNDGSTDNTKYILKKLEAEYSIQVYHIENSGPSNARNYGVSKSKGDYIAFLDSDDEWHKDKIEKQIDYMLRNNYVLSLTNLKVINEKNNIIGKQDKYLPANKQEQVICFFKGEITQNTPTIVVKRNIFEEFGGFNKNLIHREDHFFLMQVADKYGIRLLDDYLVYRRIWGSSMSSDYKKFKENPNKVIEHYYTTRYPFLEESIKHFPYLIDYLNEELSNYFYHLSHILFKLNYIDESRTTLKKSLKYNKKIKRIIKLLLLYLPKKIVRIYYDNAKT